jgi:hypothetical protein
MKISEMLKQPDKKNHILAGVLISILFGFLAIMLVKHNHFATSVFLIPRLAIFFAGFAAALIIGFLKEWIWDEVLKKGVADTYDWLATIYGGIVGGVLVWIVAFFLLSGDGKLITKDMEEKEYWDTRMENIHQNDPKSFENGSQELKDRSDSLKLKVDSLAKIMYEQK